MMMHWIQGISSKENPDAISSSAKVTEGQYFAIENINDGFMIDHDFR
jgi:hypothetical protein